MKPLRRPRCARWTALGFAAILALSAPAAEAAPYRLELASEPPLFAHGEPVVVEGSTDAPAGTSVRGALVFEALGDDEGPGSGGGVEPPAVTAESVVEPGGRFRLVFPVQAEPLPGGIYRLRVEVGEGARAAPLEADLVLQARGPRPRRPLVSVEPVPDPADFEPPTTFEAFTDRWRIVPPVRGARPRRTPLDSYPRHRFKGDFPVLGERTFLDLAGVSDTYADLATLPTPAGISTARPGSVGFFGDDEQLLGNQLVLLSGDLFRGDTAFRPIDWRVKATLALNLNHLDVEENAVVRPDVREGTRRTRGFVALQELFYERKLADLSPNYDFLSVRLGVQPFSSDFRGFVFTDTNLGVRLFGNLRSNRYQYNLAFFERLEKDTNSGLNTFELRDQRVVVANLYRQDFLVKGYTAQVSLHWLEDEATFVFDKNGFLVRPDPLGAFTPHEIEAVYLGWAGFGHVGRINLDHALYWVSGDDSLNPIAGPTPLDPDEDDSVDVGALLAAVEVSIDRDWLRPKAALLFASGDADPLDRDARGFDAIFDNPAFAGGGLSFWNRLGIRLAGAGVGLVQRGSLLPSVKSSREEGQPNFVNPGLILASLGLDAEVTPEIAAVATVNHLSFHHTETLELLLFQDGIDEEIGWDLSVGGRWRPLLNNQLTVLAGIAGFLPGEGFRDIYEDGSTLFAFFTDLKLAF